MPFLFLSFFALTLSCIFSKFPAGTNVAVGEHILALFDYRQFGYLSPYRSPALYFEKRVGGYRPIFVYGQVKVNYRDELILEQLRPIFTNIKILLFIMLHYRG